MKPQQLSQALNLVTELTRVDVNMRPEVARQTRKTLTDLCAEYDFTATPAKLVYPAPIRAALVAAGLSPEVQS